MSLADLSDFKFPAAKDVRAGELNMARQLIESPSATWKPESTPTSTATT